MGFVYTPFWERNRRSTGSFFQVSRPAPRGDEQLRLPIPEVSTKPSGRPATPFPQKVDVSDAALKAIAFGAELPGRVYETPFSILNVATGGGSDPGQKGIVDHLLDAPVIGPIFKGAGAALQWTGETASRVFNANQVQFLAETADLPDDTLVARFGTHYMVDDDGRRRLPHNITLGELRRDAAERGILPEDIEGVRRGRKSVWDFGDRPFTQNIASQLAASVLFDPTNVLFFSGIGTPIKLASWAGKATGVNQAVRTAANGIGRLPFMQQAGIKLAQAPDAVAASRAMMAGQQAWATAKGLGRVLDHYTRKVPIVGRPTAAYGRYLLDPRGYRSRTGVAGRLTAANVGLLAADQGLAPIDEADMPLVDGFVGGLRQAANEILNDRPLSQNTAWNFVAAFHYPIRGVIRETYEGRITVDAQGKTTYEPAPLTRVRSQLFGSDFKVALAKALTPVSRGGNIARRAAGMDIDIPASIKALETKLGGAKALDELIGYVAGKFAFMRMSPIVSGTYASPAYDEVIHRHAKMAEAVYELRDQLVADGRITGQDLVRTFKEWFSEQGGFEGTGVRLVWDRDLALDQWVTYRMLQAPLSKMFHDGVEVVVGRNQYLTKEDIDDIIREFTAMADKSKTVPIRSVRSMLLRTPQLVALESPDKTWWKSLGLESAPSRVKLGDITKRLRAMKRSRAIPSQGELFSDIRDYERGAPDLPDDPNGVLGPNGLREPRRLPGEATVAVSRMRPYLWAAPTNYEELLFLRTKPVIQQAESALGRVMRDSGFRVESVSQSVGGWEGTIEPSTINRFFAGATLEELRLAAALSAKTFDQDAAAVWITGKARMDEAGVKSNGYLVQLTGIPGDRMHDAVRAVRSLFGGENEGFTLDDTSGTLTLAFLDEYGGVPKGTLERLQQFRKLVGRPARLEAPRRGYIEFIERNQADDIIRRSRGDRRVQAFLGSVRAGAFGRGTRGVARPRRPGGGRRRGGDGVHGQSAMEGLLRLTDRESAAPLLAALRSEKVIDRDEIVQRWHRYDPDALPEGEIESDLLRLTDVGYDIADVRRYLDRYLETGNVAFWRQAANELGLARNLNDPASQLFLQYADLEPIGSRQIPALRNRLDDLERQGYDTDAIREALDEFADAKRGTPAWEDAWERVTLAMDALPEKPLASPLDDLDGAALQDALLSEGRSRIHELARQLGYTEIEEVVPTRGTLRYGLDDTELLETVEQLRATLAPDGTPLPGMEEQYAALSDRLDGVLQAARDRRSGIEPGSEVAKVLFDRERDAAPFIRPIRFDPSIRGGLSEDDQRMLADYERWLREHGLAYTLKKAPRISTMLRDEDGAWAAAIRYRTSLGHWLFDYGPLAQVTGFANWLFSRRDNHDLSRAARQALYNELLPHGATVAQVDRWIEVMREEASKHSFPLPPAGPRIHFFRSPTSLLPADINLIAAGRRAKGGEHLKFQGAVFSKKTIDAIGPDNFHRVFDRASNRFIRSLAYQESAGLVGKGRQAIVKGYDLWTGSGPGRTSRIVSKTFYPLFRFTADVRWLVMNALEADILGFMADGVRATATIGKVASRDPSMPTQIHAAVRPVDLMDDQWMDTTLFWNRNLGGHVGASFDARRPDSTIEVLNRLEKDHPLFREMKERFGTDDPRSLAEHLDNMLYSWDTVGTRETLEREIADQVAKGVINQQDVDAMRPLLEVLWRRHEDLYVDIARMYRGSTSRSNIERIVNSYWLFWPVSYQIKATKWLFDLLTDRTFGRQTNLGGAAWLEEQRRRHEQRLVQSEEYREHFRRLPTSWFMAQMLIPITPFDIGVSLNRATRFTGAMVGLWEPDDRTKDPIALISSLAAMGPIYTAELLERLGRDIRQGQEEAEEEEFVPPQLPAPILRPTVTPPALPALGGSGA